MKNITIAGNVGKDAEIRRTGDGKPVASFSVAVEDRQAREKSTLWFDCSLWGQRGEKLAQYITRGSRVAVTGALSTREYQGKTYLQVRVDDVTLLGGKGDGSAQAYSDASMGGEYRPENNPANLDDEIPF